MRSLLILTAISFCACSGPQHRDPADLPQIRLDLPQALESERAWYAARIASAERQVRDWFASAGHSLAGQVLIARATVFADLASARPLVASACGAESGQIPTSFSGTVCGDHLLLIDRASFRRNYERLYPGLGWSEGEYERLATHELAHRGHALVARRLFGSEEGMGPRWFFEGLAIACAGQFPGPAEDEGDDGVTRPMDYPAFAKRAAEDAHKVLSYPIYASMFRYLAKRIEPELLIREAGKPAFQAWVAERMGEARAAR